MGYISTGIGDRLKRQIQDFGKGGGGVGHGGRRHGYIILEAFSTLLVSLSALFKFNLKSKILLKSELSGLVTQLDFCKRPCLQFRKYDNLILYEI